MELNGTSCEISTLYYVLEFGIDYFLTGAKPPVPEGFEDLHEDASRLKMWSALRETLSTQEPTFASDIIDVILARMEQALATIDMGMGVDVVKEAAATMHRHQDDIRDLIFVFVTTDRAGRSHYGKFWWSSITTRPDKVSC